MSAFGQVKVTGPLTSSDTIDVTSYLVTNDAAVGINRTFDPLGYVGEVARYVDRSGGIQVGYPSFSLAVRPPVNGARVNKVTLSLSLPTLEQTSASTASGIQPAPTKAYEHMCKVEFFLPERGARWERKALLLNLISLLMPGVNASDGTPSNATATPVIGAVLDLDKPY